MLSYANFDAAIRIGLSQFLVAAVISFPIFVLYYLFRDAEKRNYYEFFVIMMLAMFGSALGFFAGASRDSIIKDFVPAIIALVVGWVGFITAKDSDHRTDAFAPGIIAFLLMMMISISYGSLIRQDVEAYQRGVDRDKMRFEQIQIPAWRKQFDLPAPSGQ